MSGVALDVEPLIENLRAAARLRDQEAVVARIKEHLESFIPDEGLLLPERYRRARPDRYCRRLLHRDPDLGFTALVMTWGPGQRTPLHDHAGIWCVEGVVEGELEVTRYELLEETAAGICTFAEKGGVRARAGSAGALIPPFEHHVLANVDTSRIALTLHVYGGEMDHCSAFLPEPGGLYRRQPKRLSYDD
ncbi:MAG: cysteine dioxygenase family protein [Acidobacteria bacterium]|nr:cysteine dioxygenase family protein [Acidobacteriota bacterium]